LADKIHFEYHVSNAPAHLDHSLALHYFRKRLIAAAHGEARQAADAIRTLKNCFRPLLANKLPMANAFRTSYYPGTAKADVVNK